MFDKNLLIMKIETYSGSVELDFDNYSKYIEMANKKYIIEDLYKIDDDMLNNIYIGKFLKMGIIHNMFIVNSKYEYFIKKTLPLEKYYLLSKKNLNPTKLLKNINNLLTYCKNYFNIINDNLDYINELEKKIIDYQKKCINDNKFIEKCKNINLSLEFICYIKNNLMIDFNYLYFKTIVLKYNIFF